MNVNAIDSVQQEDVLLINKLTRMLEEQINVIQCSDVSGRKIEAFAEQIQSIVDEITCKDLLGLEQFKDKREHIKRLYDNLNLAIIGRRNETEKQLNHIRKCKKVVGVYRSEI